MPLPCYEVQRHGHDILAGGTHALTVPHASKAVSNDIHARALLAQSGDTDTALELLRNADAVIEHAASASLDGLKALTLNNFACYYRRVEQPEVALK